MIKNFSDGVDLIKILISQKIPFRFKLNGSSMIPTIFNGDIIIVQEFNEITEGKIYLYTDRLSPTERLVCHRLVRVDGNKLFFKGDSRQQVDFPINKNQIIGEVVDIIRNR